MRRLRPARLALAGGAVVLVVVVVLLVVLAPRSPTVPEPQPTYAAPAPLPPAASHVTHKGIQNLVDSTWLDATSIDTGIPRAALAAYAGAALKKHRTMPTCGVSWNTLAAIGYVESRHGSHGGAEIADDGTVSPPIFGVSLAGGATATIPDTDQGKLDGDAQYDRAMGPMQMIPQTWRNWATDGSGDGVKDPQNIDDEVMAAANYLCRASPDMVGVAGWQKGIASYNSAPAYLHAVARAAIAYAG